jgi:chemotaxis protein MotB
MALARARRDRAIDYWPGFVDALSTLILGIVFLLSVFVVVQFYLSQEVTGKDTALARLNAQIAQLTELLAMEKTGKTSLEETIAGLRASIASVEGERDRFKGLYEGLGASAATERGKASALSGELEAEKGVSIRALAQVELLNRARGYLVARSKADRKAIR